MNLPSEYQAHILRIWQKPSANDQNQSTLHVTIENTKTAVRINFSDFDSLANYLQQQMEFQHI